MNFYKTCKVNKIATLFDRETANEISREKSATIANKVLSKTPSTVVEDSHNKKEANSIKDSKETEENVTRNDMATQWEIDEMPNDWEPIPALSLPKDDNISVKEFNINECKTDKSKRIDLFALSEEMPSSLRGTLTNEERVPIRPSVTLVSEYLQSRGMRLRETDSVCSKKTSDELQSLKQTIMKTRTSREGSNVCHVHDIELVPMPSWQAGIDCAYCHNLLHKHCKIDNPANNYQVYRPKPAQEQFISPTPILRGSSPFRRNKVCLRSCKQCVMVLLWLLISLLTRLISIISCWFKHFQNSYSSMNFLNHKIRTCNVVKFISFI